MGTFAELYCKQHQLEAGKFEQTVLRRSLPRRIRLIAPLIELFNDAYFYPERQFVRDVGAMRQPDQFKWALADFRSDPANRKFIRKQLRVRGSIAKMREIVQSVPSFVTGETGTAHPFEPHA